MMIPSMFLIKGLGVIGSPAAIDALIVASRDNDPEVRARTVWALDEIDAEVP